MIAPPFTATDCGLPSRVDPALNFEDRRGKRPGMLLLHYTGLPTLDTSLRILRIAESRVSCHYVIGEDGTIIQMVPEALRAWHAGLSIWGGETDINSQSIGVEIQNPGHAVDGTAPTFPDEQIEAVIALGLDIVRRHGIPPERVLAHSDIAPLRKMDPGERFPWARLAAAGLGAWVEPAPVDEADPGIGPGAGGPAVLAAQSALAAYGYGVPATGEMDPLTVKVVTAFQRHFRQVRVDGRLDLSTQRTLDRLLDRVRSF